MAVRRATAGFGYDSAESPYHFVVVVESKGDASFVRIEERFSAPGGAVDVAGPTAPVLKVTLDAYHWSRIADAARGHFNGRLRDAGLKPGQWSAQGETPLAPHFGKELTLIAWAIEQADPTVIPNMVANWAGLAPEERWWLYTTINATAGHPEHGRERGWRKAIKIAFAENPASQQSSTVVAGRTGHADPASDAEPPAFSLLPVHREADHSEPERLGAASSAAKRARTPRAPHRSDQQPQLQLLPRDDS